MKQLFANLGKFVDAGAVVGKMLTRDGMAGRPEMPKK